MDIFSQISTSSSVRFPRTSYTYINHTVGRLQKKKSEKNKKRMKGPRKEDDICIKKRSKNETQET